MERKLIGQLQTHHNHARHPEEQNVQPRFEEGSGVERLKVVCLFRPSHDREGEEARGEPRVEDVLVAFEHEVVAGATEEFLRLGVGILGVDD